MNEPGGLDELSAAGTRHVILGSAAPFDLGPLRALLAAADS